jgi:predicted transcriptional regulator
MRGKYWDQLVKSGWIKDPENQKKKFMEVFDKYGDQFVKDAT